MLKAASEQARQCYERAARARERALHAIDPKAQEDALALEALWLKLAASYDFSERLDRFLKRTPDLPEHPLCSCCDVKMWLFEMQSSGQGVKCYFECKTCGGKLDRFVPSR